MGIIWPPYDVEQLKNILTEKQDERNKQTICKVYDAIKTTLPADVKVAQIVEIITQHINIDVHSFVKHTPLYVKYGDAFYDVTDAIRAKL